MQLVTNDFLFRMRSIDKTSEGESVFDWFFREKWNNGNQRIRIRAPMVYPVEGDVIWFLMDEILLGVSRVLFVIEGRDALGVYHDVRFDSDMIVPAYKRVRFKNVIDWHCFVPAKRAMQWFDRYLDSVTIDDGEPEWLSRFRTKKPKSRRRKLPMPCLAHGNVTSAPALL